MVWRGGSECLTFPAGQQVCLEGSRYESSWKTFPAYTDWQWGVGLPPKRLWVNNGQELTGAVRDEPEGPEVPTTDTRHLDACGWQMFYRPENHRPVDRFVCALFLTVACFHSLAPQQTFPHCWSQGVTFTLDDMSFGLDFLIPESLALFIWDNDFFFQLELHISSSSYWALRNPSVMAQSSLSTSRPELDFIVKCSFTYFCTLEISSIQCASNYSVISESWSFTVSWTL